MHHLMPMPAAVGAVAGLQQLLGPGRGNIIAGAIVFALAWITAAAVLRRGASDPDTPARGAS